jgi:hypothetical protein
MMTVQGMTFRSFSVATTSEAFAAEPAKEAVQIHPLSCVVKKKDDKHL